jgi:HlyD family secretion protein
MIIAIVAVLLIGGAGIAWYIMSRPSLPPGIAAGNGRLEANMVYISAKMPGRIKEVLVNEGDTVEAGQVLARMDTSALEAQLRDAEAQIVAAEDSRRVSLAQISEKAAQYNFASQQYRRSAGLVGQGAVSQREAEMDTAQMLTRRAELVGARAEATRGVSNIAAARATADRLRSDIADAVLVAPIRGRVEKRLAEPGETLPAGGRVLSTADLGDVYMYVFLPETSAGKVALGSEARIVLDAAPDYPIRAFISFVSPQAQFTPKTVETAEERHNLTFRVKLQIDKARLRQVEPLVKVGLPGMGYVRTDPGVQWPANLVPKAGAPRPAWAPTGAATGPRS